MISIAHRNQDCIVKFSKSLCSIVFPLDSLSSSSPATDVSQRLYAWPYVDDCATDGDLFLGLTRNEYPSVQESVGAIVRLNQAFERSWLRRRERRGERILSYLLSSRDRRAGYFRAAIVELKKSILDDVTHAVRSTSKSRQLIEVDQTPHRGVVCDDLGVYRIEYRLAELVNKRLGGCRALDESDSSAVLVLVLVRKRQPEQVSEVPVGA